MALGDTPQSMAAMSCCPGGAVTVLGVALGHMLMSALGRVSRRRARRREIDMLAACWDLECAARPDRRV